MGITFVL